jgi:hypothetical protein
MPAGMKSLPAGWSFMCIVTRFTIGLGVVFCM